MQIDKEAYSRTSNNIEFFFPFAGATNYNKLTEEVWFETEGYLFPLFFLDLNAGDRRNRNAISDESEITRFVSMQQYCPIFTLRERWKEPRPRKIKINRGLCVLLELFCHSADFQTTSRLTGIDLTIFTDLLKSKCSTILIIRYPVVGRHC